VAWVPSPRLLSIVVIDDSADIRRLVRSRLRLSGGFDVVGEGSSGVDAVALAAQHRPDLMLLDMSMAGMDGLEAIPMILTASPPTRVVMYSGFEPGGLAEHSVSLGASAFIPKAEPITDLPRRLAEVAGVEITALATDAPLPEPDEQAVLNEHIERFREAFEQAAIGMATLSLSGRIVRGNAALARLLGTTSDALAGSMLTDVVHEQDRSGVNAMLLRVSSGVLDADRLSHRMHADRGIAWVTTTAAAVRDSGNHPLYLFIQVQDITERIATEESLRQSEERFRLLVESVRDYGIFVLDPDGKIVSWNIGAERIKGWTADEILGEHFRIFYTPDAQTSRHPEYELEVAKREGRYEEEGWRVRKDGTTFWANVVITAIRDADGSLVGFAKVTRDVTDRREVLMERDRVARERTEFLAMTAHELRGPIALVQGFSDMLNTNWRDLADEEREEMLDALVRSSTRLRRLVEDLLTASRLEAGVLDVRPRPIELRPALESIAHERSAEIDVRCDDSIVVLADPGRLQQMLGNYVANALRYGALPITVAATRGNGHVDIAVTDSGVGIADELAPRLFDKFSHGGHEESTGLGLFIVRQLARAHGGDAFLDASSPAGSRFVLRLPAPST
jgi:PAS domain S-box-containing protein